MRELGVYCEILPWDVARRQIVRKWKPKGIILSGGPESVTDTEPPRAPQALVFELGVPVLGICYGMQTHGAAARRRVCLGDHREFGYAEVAIIAPNKLIDGC